MKAIHKRVALPLLVTALAAAAFASHAPRGGVGVTLAVAADATRARGALPLKTVADIALPGPANRFDYQSYDPEAHLLFIAHLAADTVVVFDTVSNRVLADIPGISQVHGVLAVPDLHKVYASATGTNEIVAIDVKTRKVVARIPGGTYPDGMAYAPEAHKLYVSNQSGRTETVIDTRTDKRIATISLDGEAGNSQYDPVTKHIFVNVQTRGEIAEIDPQSDSVIARHRLRVVCRNHGLLIAPAQRLAFVACEDSATLALIDMKTMKIAWSASLGDDPDVLAFDEALHLLYVASETGVVSIFKERDAKLRKVAEGFLAQNAHSVAVDRETHRLYFPLQNLNGRPVLRIMEPIAKD